jgi:hypothetical protein
MKQMMKSPAMMKRPAEKSAPARKQAVKASTRATTQMRSAGAKEARKRK